MNALKDALGDAAEWFSERRPAWLTPSSERGPLRENALSKIALDTMNIKCARAAKPTDCDKAFYNADWLVHVAPTHDWKLNNGDVSPMWLLAGDLQSRCASSGSCLMAHVHTHCVERDVVRAHRLDNMTKTGEEKEGYDDLLVDDEFVLVFVWRADYEERIEYDADSPCGTLMRWKIAPGQTFNKSRDVYVEAPLIYDPKNLRLVIDDQKLAIDYGRAQSALTGNVSAETKSSPVHFSHFVDAFVADPDDDSDDEFRKATKED